MQRPAPVRGSPRNCGRGPWPCRRRVQDTDLWTWPFRIRGHRPNAWYSTLDLAHTAQLPTACRCFVPNPTTCALCLDKGRPLQRHICRALRRCGLRLGVAPPAYAAKRDFRPRPVRLLAAQGPVVFKVDRLEPARLELAVCLRRAEAPRLLAQAVDSHSSKNGVYSSNSVRHLAQAESRDWGIGRWRSLPSSVARRGGARGPPPEPMIQ